MHRFGALEQTAGLSVEYIPVFPPKEFPNDPAALPAKLAYMVHDVARIAHAYGLVFRRPAEVDCDWLRPHAAFLYALDAGRGPAFARELYASRFSRGESLADDATIAACAARVGLDATAVVAAQTDDSLQQRVMFGMMRGVQEDGLFGVPFFVHGGQRFWGNDRLEWLLRNVMTSRGLPVPDLTGSLLGPVHMRGRAKNTVGGAVAFVPVLRERQRVDVEGERAQEVAERPALPASAERAIAAPQPYFRSVLCPTSMM